MPESPIPGGKKFTFTLGKLATGAIQIDPASHPELLASLAVGGELPDKDVVLAGAEIQVAPGQTIAVGPANVGFSADASASLGVYTTG